MPSTQADEFVHHRLGGPHGRPEHQDVPAWENKVGRWAGRGRLLVGLEVSLGPVRLHISSRTTIRASSGSAAESGCSTGIPASVGSHSVGRAP